MASRTFTELIDDLDGSEADETISFAYRGTSYEIDLTDANSSAFDVTMSKYLTHARKVTRPAPKGKASRDVPAIRLWAASQGIELKSRGRIPADVVAQYDAAQ